MKRFLLLFTSAALLAALIGCQNSGVDPAVVQRMKQELEAVKKEGADVKRETAAAVESLTEEIAQLREDVEAVKKQFSSSKPPATARPESPAGSESSSSAPLPAAMPSDLCTALMSHVAIVQDVTRNEEKVSVAETLINDSAEVFEAVLARYGDNPDAEKLRRMERKMRDRYLTFLKNRHLLANPYLRNSTAQQRKRAEETARELEKLCGR